MVTDSIDFQLDETAQMIRESVRDFAQHEIAPLAAEIDVSNTFPKHLWRKMGELGLLGITVEETYGGAGLGYFAHVLAIEEISRASASVGLSYAAHSNLCVNQIRLNGTEHQKQKYLPGPRTNCVASGYRISSALLPKFGSETRLYALG